MFLSRCFSRGLLSAALFLAGAGLLPAVNLGPESIQTLPNRTLGRGGAGTSIALAHYLRDPDVPGSAVRLSFRIGTVTKNIDLALFDSQTPLTVANFMAYVNAGHYANNFIHRSNKDFIIQGGGFYFVGANTFDGVPTLAPVLNEPGISNLRGTIAMAKFSGEPNSATNQWFINLADNSANLDSQNGGFTVFGRVIGAGMVVVDEVAALPTFNATDIHPAWADLPLKDYSDPPGLLRDQFIETNATAIPALTFSAVSSNPALVAASVNNGSLQLTPAAAQTGTALITVTATDLEGASLVVSFSVEVVPPRPSRLVNLSIRSTAGAGSETLIVGLVAEGGTQNASLLVRAAGPALLPYGVTGVLVNPGLSVNNSVPSVVQTNDDWASPLASLFAQVGAFPWTGGSKDAALALDLPPAPYTAVITGAGGTTGVVLAEIYDVNADFLATRPKLVNVSARSQVGTGDNIMIAGFVIGGELPQKVLIRAVGPTLASYGVTGVLADPQIAIFNGTTQIDSNNDWAASLAPTFSAVGAFPLTTGSKDAALLVTLVPGVYTAQATGVGGTTGVALVELYAVP